MRLYRIVCTVLLLVLLAFPVRGRAGSNAVDPFFPVIARGKIPGGESQDGKLTAYLLGGWSGKAWLQDKAAAPLVHGGERYRLYDLTGALGVAAGDLPSAFGAEGEPCYETLTVSFGAPPRIRDDFVAVSATFDPLPRPPSLLSTEQQVYKDAATAILREKGIARPDVRLTQVIRVDLKGDGVEEVLVSATHYAGGLSPRAASGDYSMVFLRRVLNGKVATRLIAGDFFPKAVTFGSPAEHRIAAMLGLNGDGVMEIVLFGRYYEGDWITAFRVDQEEIVEIFSSGCGL
jgi:hypothetical protein